MIKLIGAIFLITAGAMTGIYRSCALTQRVRLLEEYITLINEIETQIRYSAQPLYQMLESMSNKNSIGGFLHKLLSHAQADADFSQAWERAVDAIENNTGITKQDRAIIREFGAGLGKTDIDGQISHCKLCMTAAQNNLENARKEKETKTKLYRSLGVLGGTACALLIL